MQVSTSSCKMQQILFHENFLIVSPYFIYFISSFFFGSRDMKNFCTNFGYKFLCTIFCVQILVNKFLCTNFGVHIFVYKFLCTNFDTKLTTLNLPLWGFPLGETIIIMP